MTFCIKCGKRLINYRAKRCRSCASSFVNMGKKNPNYGKPNKWGHHSEETKRKISFAFNSEKHPNWKGDKVGYSALHDWVKRRKQKEEICNICKKPNLLLELSNISGRYKRNIDDYEWLCIKCHRKKDSLLKIGAIKLIFGRK